jgi:hypothetical protein
MSHPVELVFHSLEGIASPSVYWIGERWSREALPALRARSWRIDLHDPAARLEFLSLPRESRDGVLIEEVPEAWSGELVQRLLAVFFQGLRPGGILFLGFCGRDPLAILAWLRQAGFEALQQGESAGVTGILARRIGGAARGN